MKAQNLLVKKLRTEGGGVAPQEFRFGHFLLVDANNSFAKVLSINPYQVLFLVTKMPLNKSFGETLFT